MDEDLIVGIIYSVFDAKFGPKSVAWLPYNLSEALRLSISLKSMNIISGEQGTIPESLSVIPFSSIKLKGLVKLLQ